MRLKSMFPALLPAVLLLAATRAESTPSFELDVSTGGVTHLAVGEKLQFRAYLPKVRRDPATSVSPLASAMTWRVEPVDLASVNSEGLLTALRPGLVRVTVEAANVPKGELGPGMPGSRSLTISKELPGGRLPRLDGMAVFEEFTVAWDKSGYDHNRGLYVGLQTFTWSAGVTTSAPPDGPLPWTLDVVPERSQFNDDRGYSDLFSQDDYKRWQGNLTSARFTISSWKDGIASGRFEFKTSRGIDLDTTFHAWVEDRSGVLARAGAPASPAANELPKVKYQGWVESDRWGFIWLSNGVHSVAFDEKVRKTVRSHVGKSMEIEAGPFPHGPLAPVIDGLGAVREISPRYGSTASLDLFISEARLLPDAVQGLQLRFAYKGNEEIEYRLRDLKILVRRRGAPLSLETGLDLRDGDDAPWRADGMSTDVQSDGSHDSTWVLRQPGEGTIKVKGEQSLSVELSTRLPAGEYEIWAVLDNCNLSNRPGVRCKRIAFDVGK